jgi:GNAT superfamily N-acetyltransferase
MRRSAGVIGVLTAFVGSAAFEALRSRVAFWPPVAATALGGGLTALLLWYASRPKSGSGLPRHYDVRAARARDLDFLPGIEREAAAAFAGYRAETGLSLAAFGDVTAIEELERATKAGRLFVAEHRDRPVGFALVEVVSRYAHLEEVDVHPAHARRGLGRALIERACTWAASHNLRGLTLITFRHVPWNAPYYERLGFSPVDPAALSPEHAMIARDEAARGFDPSRRVMMVRRCGPDAAGPD